MPKRVPPRGTEAYARYKAKRTEQKRRLRKRYLAQGLTTQGTVPIRPEWTGRGHPTDCPCYDCLFPPACVAPPRVYYVRGLRHR